MTFPQQSPAPQPAPGAGVSWPCPRPDHPQPPPAGYATPPRAAFAPPGLGYPGPVAGPPVPNAPSGEPLAEFTDRFLARLVDYGIYLIIGLILEIPVIIVLFASLDDLARSETPDIASVVLPVLGISGVVFLLSLAARYVYEVEMMFRTGQTLGKRIMKIRVTTLDGSALTRRVAARRWLASDVVAAFVPAYNWVDGLWQLWDKPYRQCLHDKFATTAVVKGEPARNVT